MSYVTDVILINNSWGKVPVRKINKWLRKEVGCNAGLKKLDCKAGGNKYMQCDVWMGAFNKMDIPLFIRCLKDLLQDSRYEIQLLIKDENEERFSW